MDKKRFTKILSKADGADLAALSADIREKYHAVVIKGPNKTLAMVKMREPVKQSLFYIGEVIVCEAAVELDSVTGFAVAMGDDTEKALDMAIIDAAVNKGVFTGMDVLLRLEKYQQTREKLEHALHLKTTVNFESLDQEAPNDLNAFKKAQL